MAKLKLTYFDFHGGRGEPARIALSMGGIPFEDERVKGTDWERRKPGTPFGALPLLEKDGEILAQSNAINRYVGRLTNLYPSDPWQAALCDEIMEAVEDITRRLTRLPLRPREDASILGQAHSRRLGDLGTIGINPRSMRQLDRFSPSPDTRSLSNERTSALEAPVLPKRRGFALGEARSLTGGQDGQHHAYYPHHSDLNRVRWRLVWPGSVVLNVMAANRSLC